MKIFNIENGIKKLYIQREDLINYVGNSKVIPDFNIKDDDLKSSKNYKKEFIEITDINKINYLNKLEWIIDYRKYSLLSEKELEQIKNEFENKLNDIAIVFNNMDSKERKENINLKEEYDLLKYKLYQILYLLKLKQGAEQICLPNKIDYKGIYIKEDDNDYIIHSAIDSNKFIITRKDNIPIGANEYIPDEFLQKIIYTLSITKGTEDDFLTKEFTIQKYYDENNKCIVISFIIINNNQFINDDENIVEIKNPKSKISRLVKKLINKKED